MEEDNQALHSEEDNPAPHSASNDCIPKKENQKDYHSSSPPNEVVSGIGIVCKFFLEDKCRFGDKCVNVHPEGLNRSGTNNEKQKRNSPKLSNKASNKNKKGKETEITSEILSPRKPSMKTAESVINRIQWDETLNKESFTVGYRDRFVGIIEKPFGSFSWEDLAGADYTVLAIPEHRIQFFKYKGFKVWDKNERLDAMFGSTGYDGTIYTFMKDVDEKQLQLAINSALLEEPQESHSNNLANHEVSVDDDNLNHDGTEGENYSASNCRFTVAEMNGQIEENQSDSSKRSPSTGAEIGQRNHRATHFICIRITDPDVRDKIKNIQTCMKSCSLFDEDDFTLDGLLHCTLEVLQLDGMAEVAEACQAVSDMKLSFSDPLIRLNIDGVATFHNKVMYAKISHNARFLQLVSKLRSNLKSRNIKVVGSYNEFKPHVTFIKIMRHRSDIAGKSVKREIDPMTYVKYEDEYFGTQIVDNLNLCVFSSDRRDDGFYLCDLETRMLTFEELQK